MRRTVRLTIPLMIVFTVTFGLQVAGAQTLAQVSEVKKDAFQAGGLHATLYLDGAVRAAAEKKETTATTGSIGVGFAQDRWRLTAQMNIAAATDTIRKAPGQSMLVPGTGGFTNGLLEGLYQLQRWPKVHLRAYYSASSFTWELPKTSADGARPVAANVLGSGAGLLLRVADGEITDAKMKVRFDITAGVQNRTLRGDASDGSIAVRRADFLGSDNLSFTGLEWGMTIAYNDIRGNITYYTFPRSINVPGFTRGQLVAGFAIAAPVIQGYLQ